MLMGMGNNDSVVSMADYALVGPVDSRVHEIRTTQFPFNTVCHLLRDFGNNRWAGCSGVLIGPRLVLTAGHCLFSHRRGGPPKRIMVVPGRSDRDARPFGTLMSRRYYVPRQYVEGRSIASRRNFDYGIIILPRIFQGLNRFLGLRILTESALKHGYGSRRATIAGYPGDRPIGTLWRHTERIRKITPRRLLYTVDTCPGHSGSPIWQLVSAENKGYVIGVHTSGILDKKGRSYGCKKGTVLAPPGMLNSGVRITQEVINNIHNPKRDIDGLSAMLNVNE